MFAWHRYNIDLVNKCIYLINNSCVLILLSNNLLFVFLSVSIYNFFRLIVFQKDLVREKMFIECICVHFMFVHWLLL